MMKNILIAILCLTSLVGCSQEINSIENVKIYLIKWEAKRKFRPNMDKFKEYHEYSFNIVKGTDFDNMFPDYNECVKNLNEWEKIDTEPSFLISLVEISFKDGQTVKVFFDSKGNYFYNKDWHKINNEFYCLLFKHFSNELIPNKVLMKAEKESKGDFWYSE